MHDSASLLKSSPRKELVRPILWLRLAATYLVAIYHAVRFFDKFPSDIFLGCHEFSEFYERFSRFVTQWHMPLFFAIAGYSLRISFSRVRKRIAFLI